MWMVRNYSGDYAEEFVKQGIVAVGWQAAGSLAALKTREDIIDRVKSTWPNFKPLKAVVSGSQLNKIANVMALGDQVMTYDPSRRIYHVGRIIGDYEFRGDVDDVLANRRKVKWEHEIERDQLSVPTKNSLGSTLTIFQLSDKAVEEIDALITGGGETAATPEVFATSEADINVQNLLQDIESRAREFIKDKIIALDWEEMQNLVAGLLRAMGYKTRVSPEGGDRGKDIIASPDGLGLEQPRIIVEVKHRPKQSMGSQDVRSYLGGRHKDDRGLYVSTGGFSKDAKYEAERASIPLTLMDIDDLVGLVVENYEKLDLETRSLLPLTRVYWPTSS